MTTISPSPAQNDPIAVTSRPIGYRRKDRRWAPMCVAARYFRRLVVNDYERARDLERWVIEDLRDREIRSRGWLQSGDDPRSQELKGLVWLGKRDWQNDLIVDHGPTGLEYHVFTHVKLHRTGVLRTGREFARAHGQPTGSKPVLKCVEFLRERSGTAPGKDIKAGLRHQAMKAIPRLTVREFNEAYAIVYARRIGRPKKEQ
jgi:hypothetical protein